MIDNPWQPNRSLLTWLFLQKEEPSPTDSESDSDNEVEDIFVIISDLKQDVAKYENQYKSSRVKGFKDSEYQEYLVRNLNKGRGKVSFSSEGRFWN